MNLETRLARANKLEEDKYALADAKAREAMEAGKDYEKAYDKELERLEERIDRLLNG